MTQQDIADAMGVSHVTVSQALHRSRRSRVSAEVQREVWRVAKQLGYQPREVTTNTVTVVVETQSLWWDVTTNILGSVDSALRAHGFRMALSTLDESSFRAAASLFNSKTTDGLIFTEWYPRRAKEFQALRVPWLSLADAQGLPPGVLQVGMDTIATARRMAEHLVQKGHKRLCVFSGEAGVGHHERFKQGVFQALGAAGLPLDNTTLFQSNAEMDARFVPLMKTRRAPTAFLAASPGGALVMLNRLQKNGYRVPQDVSLISLIDGPRLTALQPQITTTTALDHQLMETAIEHLMAKIRDPKRQATQIFAAGEIIERESVARAK